MAVAFGPDAKGLIVRGRVEVAKLVFSILPIESMEDPFVSSESRMALLAAVVESSDDAIVTKDLNGVITSWNRGARAVFGYTAEEAIGRSVTMLIPEDRIDEEPGILARIRSGEKVDHYETVRRRKDGTLIDVSLTVSPLRNAAGEIFGASKIARDITQTKRAQRELSMLAAIVESSDDAIISKDLNGIITSWNGGAERMFGYTADEAIGRSVTMLMPPERTDEEPGILDRIRRGEKVDHYETVRVRKDGTRFEISLSVSPILDAEGRVVGASKIARDISERVRAQAAAREKEMMQRIVRAQESERQRIARDLHDALGQKMTGLRLLIGTMLEKCDGYDPGSFEFQHLKQLTAQMDQDIGFLSWELRPTELDSLGLADAVKSFVREWSRQHGIETNFHFGPAPGEKGRADIPAEVEVNLYRIVQEALNNVLKHAAATNVSVVLNIRKGDISLTVEDDGKGFDPGGAGQTNDTHHGFGLTGMRERVELIKGSMDIESEPGRGTAILIRVPRGAADGNGFAPPTQ